MADDIEDRSHRRQSTGVMDCQIHGERGILLAEKLTAFPAVALRRKVLAEPEIADADYQGDQSDSGGFSIKYSRAIAARTNRVNDHSRKEKVFSFFGRVRMPGQILRMSTAAVNGNAIT